MRLDSDHRGIERSRAASESQKLTTLAPRVSMVALSPIRTVSTEAQRLTGRRRQERNAQLLREQPLCEECLAHGKTAAATEIDHKTPLHHGGTEHPSNLQRLCSPCHAVKTAAEAAARACDAT